MSPRDHRRQVLLFVVAIMVPFLVLVALSLRMIGQERELAEKRLAEDQRRLVSQIRQELLARLERIKLQEVSAMATQEGKAQAASYENTAVVLVSQVENNRLVLPWEVNRRAEEFQQLLTEAKFSAQVQQGEREELAGKQFSRAAELYRKAMNQARHPAQTAYAQLLLARALGKSGRQHEADALYRKILSLSSEVSDENGVPFSLYAAERLVEAGVEHPAALARIQTEMSTQRWLPPAEFYILRELADRLAERASDIAVREAAKETQRKITEGARHLEQALALQNDLPNLMLVQAGMNQSRNLEPLWIAYGEETWLVSLAPPLGGLRPAVVAVRAEDIFASLDAVNVGSSNLSGEVRFLTGSESKGESLGENFPGLKVAFVGKDDSALTRSWNLQRYFYFVALLLVLSVTLFGAYLLWRDVRRELRLAELRSQFVSSVSHELKTPLTAIRMFAETLRMGRPTDQHMQAEYLDTIVNESERLTRLLNNVLDFSKIEQGKKTYNLEPTSLVEVVQTSARAVEYPLGQQGFELRVDVENDLPLVRADGDALQQAILNLLTNAMKYSGESRELELRLRKLDGQAVIQVTDRGMGIAQEEQSNIFEKFYRAATPENTLIPGTGLGLTLVAHVAKAHGGCVKVQSAPGEGSTFSIHLPMETER
jgi:signal transduction histidine kinase/tetratricopeptide (TPR) repeat protein